jgi:hypothetical protein
MQRSLLEYPGPLRSLPSHEWQPYALALLQRGVEQHHRHHCCAFLEEHSKWRSPRCRDGSQPSLASRLFVEHFRSTIAGDQLYTGAPIHKVYKYAAIHGMRRLNRATAADLRSSAAKVQRPPPRRELRRLLTLADDVRIL